MRNRIEEGKGRDEQVCVHFSRGQSTTRIGRLHYKDRPVAAVAQAVSASPAVDTPAVVDMKET